MTEPAVTVAIPCRADEPGLAATLGEALARCQEAPFWGRVAVELLVCVNGSRDASGGPPAVAVRRYCEARGIPVAVTCLDDPGAVATPIPAENPVSARLLITRVAGKARAWNVLRASCCSPVVFVCDADVSFSRGAFARLHAGLMADPGLALFSPKTDCLHGGTLLERVVAAPYRFDFPNLSGQLYAMRAAEVPQSMPEDLIEPERWLELEVGPGRVGRDASARVYVRATATLADFFRQRVRIEMGKIQLRRGYPALVRRSRAQPGPRDVGRVTLREQALVGSYLCLRSLAQVWAWWRYRQGAVDWVWRQPLTTKPTVPPSGFDVPGPTSADHPGGPGQHRSAV